MAGDWLKINRSILKWGWYKDANTMRVFIDILLHTNYEDGEYMGHPVKIGQCVIGRKALAERLGISEQSVRTALKHLQKTKEITIKSTNKFSIATITNWAMYQEKDDNANQQANQQLTNNQPTTNQQLTTSKKGRREERKNNNSTIKEFVPPTLTDVRAYRDEKNLEYVDADFFYEYYSSNNWLKGNSRNGKQEPMKNWKQTMITWNKREQEKHKQNKPAPINDGLDILFGGKA